MQDMQQVIVYRNPLEAYIWNSVQSGDFSIFFVCYVVLIIVIITSYGATEKRKLWLKHRGNISIVCGVICAVITWYLIRI